MEIIVTFLSVNTCMAYFRDYHRPEGILLMEKIALRQNRFFQSDFWLIGWTEKKKGSFALCNDRRYL